MKTTELLLVTIILIIPTALAFIASILYVKKKNTIVGKFLLLGSFFMLATFIFTFYILPSIHRDDFGYKQEFFTLAIVSASIGYISFFVSFFFHIRKILKDDQKKNGINELDNIGIK